MKNNVKSNLEVLESISPEDMEGKRSDLIRLLQYLSFLFSISFSIAGIYYFMNGISPEIPIKNIDNTSVNTWNISLIKTSPFLKKIDQLILWDCFIDGNLKDNTKKQFSHVIDMYAKQWCFYSMNHTNYVNLNLIPLLHQSWSFLSSAGRIWINLTELERKWEWSIDSYFEETNKEINLGDPTKNCIIITKWTKNMLQWDSDPWIPLEQQDIFAWLFTSCEIIDNTTIQRWRDFMKIIELRGYKTITLKPKWYIANTSKYWTTLNWISIEPKNLPWSIKILSLNSFNNNFLWEFLENGEYKKETSLYILSEYFNPEKYPTNKYCVVEYTDYTLIKFEECILYDELNKKKFELNNIPLIQ